MRPPCPLDEPSTQYASSALADLPLALMEAVVVVNRREAAVQVTLAADTVPATLESPVATTVTSPSVSCGELMVAPYPTRASPGVVTEICVPCSTHGGEYDNTHGDACICESTTQANVQTAP